MAYNVRLSTRARRDVAEIYDFIDAETSEQALTWFNGLEVVILALDQNPRRGSKAPEDKNCRQIFYGCKPNAYRVIYTINEAQRIVEVVHIRHGARGAFAD